MLVDQEKLETLKRSADEMWKLKVKAEENVKATAEAKLVETLTKKWCRLNRVYDAAKELLAFETELGQEIDASGAAA